MVTAVVMAGTPLRPLHETLGARFTTFGGWEMPLQYAGILSEHMSVRTAVGVFDVSHLGRFEVAGPAATDTLRRLLCNDVARIEPGRAQYTMALNEEGGIADDIIVWRFEDRYWVMPNGTNYTDIVDRFATAGGAEVTVRPLREETVLLAVQGPQAIAVVGEVVGRAPGRFRCLHGEFAGSPLWTAGTGYTGERGAEIAVPIGRGEQLMLALIEAGGTPCGLGARDTLRLEMGYPLWGQDLDPTTTPLEAGLGWVVAWDHEFVGKEALQAQRADGVHRTLTAFKTADRRPPRPGYRLRAGGSTGVVASGTHSPMLERGIGMGYLSPPSDAPLELEMRGRWMEVERVTPPFIDR